MRKSILLATLIILSVRVHAQKGYFYIRPVLEQKVHTNNDFQDYTFTTSDNTLINVKSIDVIFHGRGWTNIGLFIGYKRKNFFLETGFVEDGTNSGTKFSCGSAYLIGSSKTYFNYRNTSTIGIAFNKIPIRLGLKLFGEDSVSTGKKLRWEGFIFAGLDFLYRPAIPPASGTSCVFYVDAVKMIKYTDYLVAGARFGLQKNIGFMLKSYNKKGAIFNLSISYSYIRKGILSFNHYYFTDSNGNEYHSSTSSNGNGLYFTFGTEININKNIVRLKKLFN